MSSIITAILKATVGLLVNKGRDKAAEKLKDGDVTDQQFRNLVVRELDDIKSKIEGLARKDLLASVSFFKEGLVFLYQLLEQPEFGKCNTANAFPVKEDGILAVSLLSASGGSKPKVSVTTSSLVEELKMLKLNALNETAKQFLADAKKRFEDARRKATEAFSNEGLKVSDRVLAMKIRIMATLMEKVDSPSTALASCRLCLEELHSIPAVQSYFEVEVTKPLKFWFNKNERRNTIAEVCHMNFVVYTVTAIVGGNLRDLFKLPAIDIGKLKIDPLWDGRLIEALSEFRLECCCLKWTFGQEGEVNHRLLNPSSITTNTQGQFIVADFVNIKVFDQSGKFLMFLSPLDTEDEQKQLKFYPLRVATDGNDNLYVLASLKNAHTEDWRVMYVLDQHYNLHHKFPLREGVNIRYFSSSLTVSNDGKVFVIVLCDGGPQVDVYNTNGRFAHSFGRGILTSPFGCDITTANEDRVMVLDGGSNSRCVHVFSTQGDHLHQFAVQRKRGCDAITFHQPSEHVIVSSDNPDTEYRGQVSIYTKDGEFVHTVQLDTNKGSWLPGLTSTVDGRIAVINNSECKAHIIQCYKY